MTRKEEIVTSLDVLSGELLKYKTTLKYLITPEVIGICNKTIDKINEEAERLTTELEELKQKGE